MYFQTNAGYLSVDQYRCILLVALIGNQMQQNQFLLILFVFVVVFIFACVAACERCHNNNKNNNCHGDGNCLCHELIRLPHYDICSLALLSQHLELPASSSQSGRA